ncbi:MAG: tetratricopeptide repeat protein [Bacteroidia bacterium]|nr:tetratricopeptide repeat protein [Bacteroidia bacterium]
MENHTKGLGTSGWRTFLESPRNQVILVGLLAFLLYLPTLNYGYALDDDFLTQNTLVDQGLQGLPDILTHGYHYGYNGANDLAYRPHILAMFTVERVLVGDNPRVHHLGNILLYVLAGMMLTLLLQRMFWNRPALLPLLVAVLWVSLPVHSEVVCSIKNREETLVFTYLVLTLLFFIDYMKHGRSWRMALALLAFLLALLTKENAITFLLVIPLMCWFFSEAPVKKWALASLAFLIPAGLYLGLRSMALDDLLIGREIDVATNSLVAEGHWHLGSLLKIQGKYLQLTVLPLQLSWDYSYQQISLAQFSDPWAWLSLVGVLGLLALGGWALVRKKAFGFGILFYFITLSLVSNLFFLMGTVMGERFLFTPSLGSCIFGVMGILHLVEKTESTESTRVPTGLVLGTLTVSLLFCLQTLRSEPPWKDKMTLFEAGIKSSPRSAKTHLALATEYLNLGESLAERNERDKYFKRAAAQAQESLDLLPEFGAAWYVLGTARFDLQQFNLAEAAYLKSIEKGVKVKESCNYLGVMYLLNDDFVPAAGWFQKSVEAEGGATYERPWINLGIIASRLGDFPRAISYFERALEINPHNPQAQRNLTTAREDLQAAAADSVPHP